MLLVLARSLILATSHFGHDEACVRACVRANMSEPCQPWIPRSSTEMSVSLSLSLSSLPFALDDVMMTTRVCAALTEETILFEAGPEIL